MEALWLRKESNTRAVILFHAYTGTPADVRMLAQFLHRHDYAVYVPVFSGHGTPDVEDILASSPEAWYEDAKSAVDFVRGEGFHGDCLRIIDGRYYGDKISNRTSR